MALNVIAVTSTTVAEQIRQQLENDEIPRDQARAIARRVDIPYRTFNWMDKTCKAYDIIVDSIDEVEAMQGYAWHLVGIWDCDTGELLSEFNRDLYMEILPDEVEYNEDGIEVNRERPSQPRDIHLRGGQAPRQFA